MYMKLVTTLATDQLSQIDSDEENIQINERYDVYDGVRRCRFRKKIF